MQVHGSLCGLLGSPIDAKRLHSSSNKVKLIKNALISTSITKLKSCVGLLTSNGKFLPNLAPPLRPLYELLGQKLQGNGRWLRRRLSTSQRNYFPPSIVGAFFHLNLWCIYLNIGVIVAHSMPDAYEKHIGYASNTLNKAGWNFSQLEKEKLSCSFELSVLLILVSTPLQDENRPQTTTGSYGWIQAIRTASVSSYSWVVSLPFHILTYSNVLEHHCSCKCGSPQLFTTSCGASKHLNTSRSGIACSSHGRLTCHSCPDSLLDEKRSRPCLYHPIPSTRLGRPLQHQTWIAPFLWWKTELFCTRDVCCGGLKLSFQSLDER